LAKSPCPSLNTYTLKFSTLHPQGLRNDSIFFSYWHLTLFSHRQLALNIKTIFRIQIDFFKKEGNDYGLVGAFALKSYGYLRATQDVDFLIRRNQQNKFWIPAGVYRKEV